MATYKPKKKIDNNGTLDDIKFPMDSIYGLSDEFKKKGVHFISDSDITVTSGSSSLSEKWVVNGVDGITEPFDGMLIAIRTPSRGLSSKGVVLSIDGGNNYNSLVIIENASVSSFSYEYENQTTILFSFNAVRARSAYLESNVETRITGCWETADRDNNSFVSQYKDSEDKEKPILTKSSNSTSNSTGSTMFSPNVTVNHSKGRISATELRENGVSLADKYATKDKMTFILPAFGNRYSFAVDPDGLYYDNENVTVDYESGRVDKIEISDKIPIVAGDNVSITSDEENKVFKINATGGGGGITGLYLTGEASGLEIDWNGLYYDNANATVVDSDGNETALDTSFSLPIMAGENIDISVDGANKKFKISTDIPTEEVEAIDLPTVKAKLTPASEVGGGDVVSITDIASFEIEDIPTIRGVDDGAGILVENKISPLTKEGEFLDPIKLNTYIPITAGEGIEFEADDYNQTVSIKATSGSGGGISGAWTSGTSGSVTLPSAGLYELKVTLGLFVVSVFINWDGTTPTLTTPFTDMVDTYVVGIVGGIINIINAEDGETPLYTTISYRRIGEA